MRTVFLGPLLHWLIIIALIVAGWIGGSHRMHVSEFNPFLIVLIVTTMAIPVIVLNSSPPGRRVTRDPVEEDAGGEVEGDASGNPAPHG